MTQEIKFTVQRNCVLNLIDTVKPKLFEYNASVQTGKSIEKFSGFIFEKDIKKLISSLKKGSDPPNETSWIKVTSKFLEELRYWGYSGENYKAWKNWEEAGRTGDILVKAQHDSNMIFDHNDVPLSVGIYFDYIMAGINNKNYDLNKVHKILSKRSDVHDLSLIQKIPYYNSEPEKDETIYFIWSPSRKDYIKMWKRCIKIAQARDKKLEFASCRQYEAIFELDLLGLRKGKAAKYKTFLGEYV